MADEFTLEPAPDPAPQLDPAPDPAPQLDPAPVGNPGGELSDPFSTKNGSGLSDPFSSKNNGSTGGTSGGTTGGTTTDPSGTLGDPQPVPDPASAVGNPQPVPNPADSMSNPQPVPNPADSVGNPEPVPNPADTLTNVSTVTDPVNGWTISTVTNATTGAFIQSSVIDTLTAAPISTTTRDTATGYLKTVWFKPDADNLIRTEYHDTFTGALVRSEYHSALFGVLVKTGIADPAAGILSVIHAAPTAEGLNRVDVTDLKSGAWIRSDFLDPATREIVKTAVTDLQSGLIATTESDPGSDGLIAVAYSASLEGAPVKTLYLDAATSKPVKTVLFESQSVVKTIYADLTAEGLQKIDTSDAIAAGSTVTSYVDPATGMIVKFSVSDALTGITKTTYGAMSADGFVKAEYTAANGDLVKTEFSDEGGTLIKTTSIEAATGLTRTLWAALDEQGFVRADYIDADGRVVRTERLDPATGEPVTDNHAPSWHGTENASVRVGQGFIIHFGNYASEQDANDGINFSVTMEDGSPLPSWITIGAPNGIMMGDPPADATPGVYRLTVTATDFHGASSSVPAVITVIGNQAPKLSSPISQITVQAGEAILARPAEGATDADGDILSYTVSLADGSAIPDWLSFDAATGRISGKAPSLSAATDLDLVVTVDDGHGGALRAVQHLHVEAAPPPLPDNHAPILATALRGVTLYGNQDFNRYYGGSFTDVDGDKLTFSATRADGSALPSWMHFDGTTGRLTGHAPDFALREAMQLRITADDGHGGKVSTSAYFMLMPSSTASRKGDDGGHGGHGFVDVQRGSKGDDSFTDDAGRDRYVGRQGDDLFVFAEGGGSDRIDDLGKRGDADRLDLSAWATETDLDEFLVAHATARGHDLILDNGLGDRILLKHVSVEDLTSDVLIL